MQKFWIISLCFVMFATVMSTGVYASTLSIEGYENYPTFDVSDDYQYHDYMFFSDINNSKILVVFSSNSKNQIQSLTLDYSKNKELKFTTNAELYRTTYTYVPSQNRWGAVNQGVINANTTISIGSGDDFLYSTIDITDLNTGEVVFMGANQALTLEEVVQAETLNLHNKTIQTMKIIVLCGVGCLALLIGLKILPKILYRFLGR